MDEGLRQAVEAAAAENAEEFTAVAAALRGEQAEEPEAEEDGAADSDRDTDVPPEGSEEEAPEAPEGEESAEGTDEPPTSYFGVDLSEFPPEVRQSIFDELKSRDSLINNLMQRNNALEKGAPTPEQPQAPVAPAVAPAPAGPTDEELLAAAGLRADDPMFEVLAPTLLPVLKQQRALTDQLEELTADREAQETFDAWTSALGSLEEQYGAVVDAEGNRVPQTAIIEFAIEHNIGDPAAAFHAYTAPVRRAVEDAAARARREALEQLKREQAGAVRPRASDTKKKREIPRDSLTEAVKAAAKYAEEDTGFSWESAAGVEE